MPVLLIGSAIWPLDMHTLQSLYSPMSTQKLRLARLSGKPGRFSRKFEIPRLFRQEMSSCLASLSFLGRPWGDSSRQVDIKMGEMEGTCFWHLRNYFPNENELVEETSLLWICTLPVPANQYFLEHPSNKEMDKNMLLHLDSDNNEEEVLVRKGPYLNDVYTEGGEGG